MRCSFVGVVQPACWHAVLTVGLLNCVVMSMAASNGQRNLRLSN